MRKLILITLLTGITSILYSQNAYKNVIKDYDSFCFCSVGLEHPNEILKLDNNLEIIFALKNTKTLHDLSNQGIKYNQSQISLLETAGLIIKKDSVYYTTIPIFSRDETNKIREQTKAIAENIVLRFQKQYKIFAQILKTKGLENNTYSLFFAFVMDGIVWNILKQDGVILTTQVTQERPFWNGLLWLVQPKREFYCGTNSMSDGNLTINVNWKPRSTVSVSSYKTLGELLNDYKENGKITNPIVFKTFEANGLFNKTGELQIPIIKADSTDAIYNQAIIIAKIIVEYLNNELNYSQVLGTNNDLDKSNAVIILYHEIMWDILDIMESTGQIKKPIAFREHDKAKSEDLKDLIFIIESPNQ
jgi:hypothetical protein